MYLTQRSRLPEGHLWHLAYLEAARDEALKMLTDGQYWHVVDQFESLTLEESPSRSAVCDVRSIDAFFELREKGGVLGKINFRGYFFLHSETRTIVVLACYKKEDEGPTPTRIIARVNNRKDIAEAELSRLPRSGRR